MHADRFCGATCLYASALVTPMRAVTQVEAVHTGVRRSGAAAELREHGRAAAMRQGSLTWPVWPQACA